MGLLLSRDDLIWRRTTTSRSATKSSSPTQKSTLLPRTLSRACLSKNQLFAWATRTLKKLWTTPTSRESIGKQYAVVVCLTILPRRVAQSDLLRMQCQAAFQTPTRILRAHWSAWVRQPAKPQARTTNNRISVRQPSSENPLRMIPISKTKMEKRKKRNFAFSLFRWAPQRSLSLRTTP